MKIKSEPVIETIPAKHEFSDKEKLELGNKLALTNQKIGALEDQKKQMTSNFKSLIDGEEATANLLSNHISSGYEMRPTECEVDFYPKAKRKEYRRISDGKIVAEFDMTQADFQMHFPLKVVKDEEKEKAEAKS